MVVLKEAVKDYELRGDMSVDELVKQMDEAWGFTAGKLSVGVNILERMFKAENCVNFLSFTANIVSTGTRGVFKELLKQNFTIPANVSDKIRFLFIHTLDC